MPRLKADFLLLISEDTLNACQDRWVSGLGLGSFWGFFWGYRYLGLGSDQDNHVKF